MSAHLDEKQVAQYLSGDAPAGQRMHVAECAACRARIDRLENAFGAFRQAALTLAEQQCLVTAPVPLRSRARFAVPVLAAAALVFSIVAGLTYSTTQHQPSAVAQKIDDAALLQAISTDVQRKAPQSLSPLLDAMGHGQLE